MEKIPLPPPNQKGFNFFSLLHDDTKFVDDTKKAKNISSKFGCNS